MAHYIQQKLAEYNKKYPLPSATSLDKKDGKDENRPSPDPGEQIVSNADELVTLTTLKKSLKSFYTQLVKAGKQRTKEHPAVFSHILKSIATERIRYIYKKNEQKLIKIYKSPYKGLIGLVNNTNILLKSMYSNPPHQGPSEKQYSSESFEPIKLDQPPKYFP